MNNIENKMNSAVHHFEKELSSLRTSRANPSILDNIYVDAYGSKTPLNQLGNISVQDANTITIQIWDSSLIKPIVAAFSDDISSPVNNISIECLLDKFLEIATIGVEQNKPILTPGVANLAEVFA